MEIFSGKNVIQVREKVFRPLQTRRQVSATAYNQYTCNCLIIRISSNLDYLFQHKLNRWADNDLHFTRWKSHMRQSRNG